MFLKTLVSVFSFFVVSAPALGSDSLEIKKVIARYVQGAAKQDAAEVGSAFHSDYRVVVKAPEKVMVLSREAYLSLLKEKKIGGNARTHTVSNIRVQEGMATAEVEIEEEKSRFFDNLSLIKAESGWKLMHNLTQMKAK